MGGTQIGRDGGTARSRGGARSMFAVAEWRRRWRSHVVLGLILALTVGVFVAALTAANRSQTAFDRLRKATRASDFQLTASNPATAALRHSAGVTASSDAALAFVSPSFFDYFPSYTLYATAPLEDGPAALDAPVVIDGRAADPSRADEVALGQRFADALAKQVGDELVLRSASSDWVDKTFSGEDAGAPDGPTLHLTVVGIVRSPADFSRYAATLYLSRAFAERYEGKIRIDRVVDVQLADDLRAEIERGGASRFEAAQGFVSPFVDDAATDDGLGTIASALRLIGFAAALAGGTAAAVAASRVTSFALRDRPTYQALGWTSREQSAAMGLVLAPCLLIGLGLGLLVGTVAAPRAMIGLARSADPTPGRIGVDLPVVAAALALSAVFFLTLYALIARAFRSGPKPAKPPSFRRPVTLRRPIPAVIGIRHAFFGEPARGGRMSRTAFIAVVVGVGLATAALTVSSSIARIQVDPGLTGQSRNRLLDSGESTAAFDKAMPLLEADDRVASLAGLHIVFDIMAGRQPLTALSYDLRRGDLGSPPASGRTATNPDEITLGPKTLEDLHKHVGDKLVLTGPKGRETFTIVGTTLFPEGDFSHDQGLAMTTGAVARIAGDPHESGSIHQVLYDWADGVDAEAADKELTDAGFTVLTNANGLKPAVVTNLDQVRNLPRFLAAFVGLLFLIALGYAITIDVQLRSREIATLRAVGLTRRGGAAVTAIHAVTILLAGLVLGVPLGLAVGKQIWRAMAERAHLVVVAVPPWATLLTFAVFVALGAAAVALVPTWRTFRLDLPESLRAE